MSRHIIEVNDNTDIIQGTDCAIGYFIDITDKRFAQSGKDWQGEGYLVEWNSMTGFTNNRINLRDTELRDIEQINRKIEIFLSETLLTMEDVENETNV